MNNSRFFNDIQAAKEFETEAMQMFNYATDNNVIEAACYFMKGAELMQKHLCSVAIKEAKEDIEK